MLLHILRAVFVLMVAGLAMTYAEQVYMEVNAVAILVGAIGLGVFFIGLDVFIPRKSLSARSGLFFGLVGGLVIAYGLSLVVDLVVASRWPELIDAGGEARAAAAETSGEAGAGVASGKALVSTIKLLIGVICCYLSVSFVLQTKDDIRFVIPYVEFSKQTRGARPFILDTSAIVDGRIADICETGIIESHMIVPRFVLQELQTIADSGDRLKRNRGRRGLDILNKLLTSEQMDVRIEDVRLSREEAGESVDQKLVSGAKRLDGRVVTNDYNLNKIAQLRGVEVINVNDLANALKPLFLPGETLAVKIIKPGEEPGQGVGYLEDGTMVVVESGQDKIGETTGIAVTSVLQTSAGRMIFGRVEGAPVVERRRPRARQTT